MEWQPIKTAPKDGRQIILFDEMGSCSVALYYTRDDGFSAWEVGHNEDSKSFLLMRVTHWMPLPEPPKGGA